MYGSNFREKKTKKIVNAKNINGNSNYSTLSHSIKIFNHKTNSIESKDLLSHNSINENSIINLISPKSSKSPISPISTKNQIRPMNDICFIHLKDLKTRKIMKKKYNIIFSRDDYNKKSKEKSNEINEYDKQTHSKNISANNSINHTITQYIKNINSNISLNLSKNTNSSISLISKKEYNITKIKPDKNKIKTEIKNASFRIKLLNNVLTNTIYKYRQQKIINYKNENKDKLLYLKKNFIMENSILQKNIFIYKLKLSKMPDNYIKIDKLKDDIEKQELIFKKQKSSLIEKIMDLSIFINQLKNNNSLMNKYDNSISYSDMNDLSIDEMLFAKNRNVYRINHFCLNKFHK
jgi:hypothetical protein